MRIYHISVLILLSATRVFCQDIPEEEGYVRVEGGRIWYKKVGNGPGTPLIILHGGPGSSSTDQQIYRR